MNPDILRHIGKLLWMVSVLVTVIRLTSPFPVMRQEEVPVSGFWGEDAIVTMPTNTTFLRFSIMPSNATVFWLKCYHGNRSDSETLFYGYDHSSDRVKQWNELGNRTHHTLIHGQDRMDFVLVISGLQISDLGHYLCLMEAANRPEESLQWHARLRLKRTFASNKINPGTSATDDKRRAGEAEHILKSQIIAIGIGVVSLVLLLVATAAVVIYKKCTTGGRQPVTQPDQRENSKQLLSPNRTSAQRSPPG